MNYSHLNYRELQDEVRKFNTKHPDHLVPLTGKQSDMIKALRNAMKEVEPELSIDEVKTAWTHAYDMSIAWEKQQRSKGDMTGLVSFRGLIGSMRSFISSIVNLEI